MKIAVVLNAHGHTELTLDTISSIRQYVTDRILVVVDGAHWSWGESVDLPAYKLQGLVHNYVKGPYRNYTFGLYHAHKMWPDMDWYCYTEYDALFASESFKDDLKNEWCVGIDERTGDYKFPLLEAMLKEEIEVSKYLLGCCVFHNGEFVRHLADMNFFERFLFLTNDFPKGFFPGYEEQGGYDFGEHLYPTLAHHFGGEVKGLSRWQENPGVWRGDFRKYPIRWKPELDPQGENFPEAAIMHPVKSYNHVLRQQQRVIRRRKR